MRMRMIGFSRLTRPNMETGGVCKGEGNGKWTLVVTVSVAKDVFLTTGSMDQL